MEAKIVGFKRSHRNVNNKYCILESSTSLASLIGKSVRWQTPSGRFLSGSVVRTHGKSSVLAKFSKGLPGTAVGSIVVVGQIGSSIKISKKRSKTQRKKESLRVKKAKTVTAKKKPEKKKKTPRKVETKKKEGTKKKEPIKKAKSTPTTKSVKKSKGSTKKSKSSSKK
ncbi:MAG: 50S ribosomal protein L35ae [Candidatus Hydrothermarchaeales archaeon]